MPGGIMHTINPAAEAVGALIDDHDAGKRRITRAGFEMLKSIYYRLQTAQGRSRGISTHEGRILKRITDGDWYQADITEAFRPSGNR